jgi:hypothetical protein
MTGAFALVVLLAQQGWQLTGPCATLQPRSAAARREAVVADSLFRAATGRFMAWPVSALEERLLREYGAPIAAADSQLRRPSAVVYFDAGDVTREQQRLGLDSAIIGTDTITLQAPALRALRAAMERARRLRLRISPAGDRSASLRHYLDTELFWNVRVDRRLARLTEAGRLTAERADTVRTLAVRDQIERVLAMEDEGYCFGGTGEKTILHSVAAPGSSQHLFGYAIDVAEHDNARVRRLLATMGFRQTVLDDQPHFTYLGARTDAQLRAAGLVPVRHGGRTYWVPPPRLGR